MSEYTIKWPMWNEQKVGIAEHRFKREDLRLTISYEDKTGKRLYPDDYIIPYEKMRQAPVEVHRGIPLRMFPIAELEKYNGDRME